MIRLRSTLIPVFVILAAGCGDSPRVATSGSQPTLTAIPIVAPKPIPPVLRIPVAFQGTWRASNGDFILIGIDRVALACAAFPHVTSSIRTLNELSDTSLVLDGDQGVRLILARGQDTRTRTVGDLVLAAEAPVMDIGVTITGYPDTTLRLWGEASLTWLPIMAPTAASIPMTPGTSPRAPNSARDQAFLAAAAACDRALFDAAYDLCQAATIGTPPHALDQLAASIVRHRQLAALEALEATLAGDQSNLAKADQHTHAASSFNAAYRIWSKDGG